MSKRKAAPGPIPGDEVMRSLARGLGGADIWASRSPTNKSMMVVREVADRLGGLSTVAYGLAFAEMAKGSQRAPSPLRSEFYFIAQLAADLAGHLDLAYRTYRDAAEGEDNAPAAQRAA